MSFIQKITFTVIFLNGIEIDFKRKGYIFPELFQTRLLLVFWEKKEPEEFLLTFIVSILNFYYEFIN